MGEPKLKVQIIGYGVVGKAQEFLMKQLGCRVTAHDPFILPKSKIQRNVDITFICTPENVVEDVIDDLCSLQVEGLYVIKSTVPVGTTEALMKKYNVHICRNPEFLREKHAFEDVMNPDRVVIGQCCEAHGQLLFNLYSPLKRRIFLTTPTTSELTKLVSNAYLSTLITFWNEIAELAKKLDLDVKEVAELVTTDHRMSRYGTVRFGEPFDGKCLPKDLNHLINTFKSVDCNPMLFEAVRQFNPKLKGQSEKC